MQNESSLHFVVFIRFFLARQIKVSCTQRRHQTGGCCIPVAASCIVQMAIIQWPCNNLSSVLLVGIAFYLIFQNSFFLTHFLLSFRLARHVRAVNPINIEQYLCSGHAGICNLESLGVDSYNVQQLKVAVIRKTGVRCFLVFPTSNSFKCFLKYG